MTVRICSHRRLLLPMQSDVLNEQQQQLSNDTDCSSSLSTTTLIYSGLKLVCYIQNKIQIFISLFIYLASKTTCTNNINARCGKSIINS
jgi:hypothetical protein